MVPGLIKKLYNKIPEKKIKNLKINIENGISRYYIIAAIILLTIIIFSNSLENGFISNWDDDKNVVSNFLIRKIDFKNLTTYFTSSFIGMYVPLTMLSYAIDFQIGGNSEFIYHISSLLFHIINITLIFYLINLITGKKEISAISTLLFAIHPMNVECIDWISARSSLLFSLFYISSLICYTLYLKKNYKNKYLVFSFILFLLSCLSKSQAMTLSVLLLVFDYWFCRKISLRVIIEKIPFFLLSIVFGIITILLRSDAGHLATYYSAIDKIILSFSALAVFLFKFLMPYNLSAYYANPIKLNNFFPIEYYIFSFIVFIIIFIIVKYYKNNKYIVFGTLFFLTAISITSLKIVPFGNQIIAERYCYIPYIGLYMIFAYLFNNIKNYVQSFKIKIFITSILAVYILFLSVTTYSRNKIWKNGIILWSDVIKKHPEQEFGWWLRGNIKTNFGDFTGAIADYKTSIKIKPDYTEAFYNRGISYRKINKFDSAIADFTKAIELKKNYIEAYLNRGNVYYVTGKYDRAITDYNIFIKIRKDSSSVFFNRGMAYIKIGKYDSAICDFNKAIELKPDDPDNYLNRSVAKAGLKDYIGSLYDNNKVLNFNPEHPIALYNRGVAKLYLNDRSGACNDWLLAQKYGYANATNALNLYCK